MNSPIILVPNNVPTDPEQAKDMKEKIKEGVYMAHPDYQDEIMDKLNSVISGNDMDNGNPFLFDSDVFEKKTD